MNVNNKFLFFLFFSLLFYAVLIRSFYITASDGIDTHKTNLVNQADLHYQDVVNTRAWNASLGGVYAYSSHYKPNPYLDNNTIKDDSGTTMIKINPAWMTRMLSEYSKNENYKFSLKSNNPVNPVNKATGFYANSLKEITQTVDSKNNKRYRTIEKTKKFEYIQGLYLKESCVVCHYKVDDKINTLRGGVAIEIDAKFFYNRVNEIWNEFYSISAIVTLLFIFLIVIVYKFINRTNQVEVLNRTLEDKVKDKTRELDNALEGARLGYWNWNIQTGEHHVDDRWLMMLGLTKNDILYKTEDWNKRIHPNDLENVNRIIDDAISSSKPYVVEFRMKHINNEYIWIQGSGSIISYDKNNKPLELAGTHQDITNRKLLEQTEIKNSIYLNNLFDKNPNMIIVTDGNLLLKVNQTFLNFFKEYSSLETFLQEHDCICDFFEKTDDENFITNLNNDWIEEIFKKDQPIVKIRYTSKEYYFTVQAKKIYEEDSIHYMVIFSDITELYNLKQEYEKLSIIDPLTQLYNRRHFSNVFTQEINRSFRAKQSLTFLIIDVDNFKLYNDNYGHDKGDVLLAKLANQLKLSSKRSNEFVFRLGGEEFGIIYSTYTKEESLSYANNICKSIKDMNIVHKENSPYNVLTVSIGHFFTTSTSQFGSDDIYHNADIALYYAKEHGRNRVDDYDDIK